MNRITIGASLLVFASAACAQTSGDRGVVAVAPNRASCAPLTQVDSAGLLSDVFRLAADSMMGRYMGSPEGAKARDFIAARFDALGLGTIAPGRIHPITVPASARLPDGARAWNIVGLIRGTQSPEQYVVITAHFDHVRGATVAGDSIYNGADDNASGTAALMAMAKYFRQNPPRHSVVLAAVDGEERGMWGSRHFVDTPTVPLEKILVNVNMDMIGRNVKNELYAAGPGKWPLLRPSVAAAVVCAPLTLLLGHDTPAAGPGNDWTTQSDQGSFHRKNIPFVYFGVEDHPDYHKPSDHPERLMPGFYVNAVRTIIDYVKRFDANPVMR